MTALLGILTEIWPFLLAGAGALWGLFAHQRAKTATAQASQQVAEAQKREAEAGAAVASANTQAAQTGAQNQEIRRDENNAAAAVPDAGRVLRDEWSRD